jgi:hypothetical protein
MFTHIELEMKSMRLPGMLPPSFDLKYSLKGKLYKDGMANVMLVRSMTAPTRPFFVVKKYTPIHIHIGSVCLVNVVRKIKIERSIKIW